MKLTSIFLMALTALSCSTEGGLPMPTAPTAPTPSAPPTPVPPTPTPVAFLAGMVLGAGGGCIVGATVEVVGGQGLGQTARQVVQCSWWDWEDGFEFRELVPGVEVTLRASAPSFVPAEKTFLPSLAKDGRGRYLAILELSSIP